MLKKIWVISSSRTDYNANKWVLDEMRKHSDIQETSLCIGGFNEYETLDSRDIFVELEGEDIFHFAANVMKLTGELLERSSPDYIFVLGDRWETLQICIAATLNNISIIHQGGGERSEGVYDDYFRDCISKLSKHHFVIHENCQKRLKKIGIYDNIYITGSPRMDYKYKLKQDKDILNRFGLDQTKKTALVIYHPETKSEDIEKNAKKFFDILDIIDLQYVIIYPNYDKGSQIIFDEINRFRDQGTVKYTSLPLEDYLSVLSTVDIMIGNSSAGILETPTFNLPCVNVGNRQKGRDRSHNVIDANYDNIEEKVRLGLSVNYRESMVCLEFGDGSVSKEIVDIIRSKCK